MGRESGVVVLRLRAGRDAGRFRLSRYDLALRMPSYRFCRPDTVPLLVEALNACWGPHFPDEPEMTVERFRREMRELDVWPSNSMVALEGDDPVAVIIGTKREHEVLIHRLAVAPGNQRQGHGSHLVMSLSHKLAVLGPPRLAAEVTTDNEPALALFAALDFHRDTTLSDWTLVPPEAAGVPAGRTGDVTTNGLRDRLRASAILAVPVEDLVSTLPETASWHRSPRTLQQASSRLQGFARNESWVVLDPDPQPPHVLALAGPTAALATLISDLATAHGGRLFLPRYAETEMTADLARALPLRATRRYDRVIAAATPA
ncbi:MAG: GNAT family N-acetyltransferase [Thermoanaerobaculia bacterium]